MLMDNKATEVYLRVDCRYNVTYLRQVSGAYENL